MIELICTVHMQWLLLTSAEALGLSEGILSAVGSSEKQYERYYPKWRKGIGPTRRSSILRLLRRAAALIRIPLLREALREARLLGVSHRDFVG